MKPKSPALLNGILLILMMVFSSTHLHAGKKVIKWVDSKGVTHYGDKPPIPSTTSSQHRIITEETGAGVESKSNKSQVSEGQQRRDHALLSTFASVDEIEIARKRNVKIDELTLESLKQQRSALKASAEKNMQSNSAELSRLQNLELQIEVKRADIANTNERYHEDKLRYLELKAKGN